MHHELKHNVYNDAPKTAVNAELDTGRVHPRVGSGWVGSGRVQLCGSVWVTLDDTECYAKM